eukprot:CAMPEP_0203649772 /NCGR_PEP_ID=MMETSP0088-20131115/22742_1 /ASSEMBLY_ACC=CAM_ASM_001087 /TAXON_ID=426623 /ORGANISM="Chaetoceros affinis, Strain CCMP159" /LENGTH=94 /DNA_ID=CAMNT_0050508295 /DNA_START=1 /DNA_END=282 /DNA_ORIENTATION=+
MGYYSRHNTPTLVDGISNVSAIALGGWHSCALNNVGDVYCWGDNYGSTPTIIVGINSVRNIAVGGYHSCAVDDGGLLYCWGSNYYGQLGTGDTT